MNSLTLLQQSFQDYLLGKSKQAEKHVTGPHRTFIKQRLAIYGEGYQLRLVEVLGTDFPGLLAWLGEKKFTKICLEYINRYPSRFYAAREFGQHFSTYLATIPAHNKTSFLAEFSAFERALSELIDAANAPILALEDIAAIDPSSWPTMQLSLHPSLKCFQLYWNVPELRQELLLKQQKIKAVKSAEIKYWVVWRRNLDICFKEISQSENYIIEAIHQNLTFEEICEGLTNWLAEQAAAQFMVTFLQTWLPEQIFSKVIIK